MSCSSFPAPCAGGVAGPGPLQVAAAGGRCSGCGGLRWARPGSARLGLAQLGLPGHRGPDSSPRPSRASPRAAPELEGVCVGGVGAGCCRAQRPHPRGKSTLATQWGRESPLLIRTWVGDKAQGRGGVGRAWLRERGVPAGLPAACPRLDGEDPRGSAGLRLRPQLFPSSPRVAGGERLAAPRPLGTKEAQKKQMASLLKAPSSHFL